MIRASGEPVVMDFGPVISVEQESKSLTQLGSLIGTMLREEMITPDRWSWLAPERGWSR
jgi:hypothetical protein